MQPTDVLKGEHRVIEQVLRCLWKLADRCDREGTLDEWTATQMIDFFHEFGDLCHHEKEEKHLFPLLEARGLSPQYGPTNVMRHEHEQARHHIRTMTDALKGAVAHDPDAVAEFVQHARAYAQLMEAHIRKEDECLFPMADRMLSAADQRILGNAFTSIHSNREHALTQETCLLMANDLADQFEVPHAAAGHVPM